MEQIIEEDYNTILDNPQTFGINAEEEEGREEYSSLEEQQKTEVKQIKPFKIMLSDVEQFKKQIKVANSFLNEVKLKITPDDFGFLAMEPANVCMLDFKVLSSNCTEYNITENTELGINLNNFFQVLKVIKKDNMITLSCDVEANKFVIEAKGVNTKRFTLPIIDIEEKDTVKPELQFSAKIITDSKQLKEELEAVDTVAEAVTLKCYPDKLVLNGDGSFSFTQLDVTIKADENTKITAPELTECKYSLEYLKKILGAGILTDTVTLEFSKEYPMRVTYKDLVNPFILSFILAPRINN